MGESAGGRRRRAEGGGEVDGENQVREKERRKIRPSSPLPFFPFLPPPLVSPLSFFRPLGLGRQARKRMYGGMKDSLLPHSPPSVSKESELQKNKRVGKSHRFVEYY